MKVVFNSECVEYEETGHPERPERVKNSYEYLKSNGMQFVTCDKASINDVRLVHTEEHLENVKNGNFYEPDTPNIEGIFDYALLAAGGAIKAMEIANHEPAFSLMRPPGHHATRSMLGGFCYFNNIAIAVEKALRERKVEHVVIVDIDAHHGNGTQDIFLGRKNVLYISLHQAWIYPGTGMKSEANCINYPLQAGTGDEKYIETLKNALDHVRTFKPDMLAVSAGFDTLDEDPLTGLMLSVAAYKEIGKMLSEITEKRFGVLEGGYSKKMPLCVYNFLSAFGKS